MRRPFAHRTAALAASLLAGALLVSVAAAPQAAANTPVPDGSALASFVAPSSPQWNFARANSHDACWPTAALDAAGGQTRSAGLKNWPVAGQGGCSPRGSAFPQYWSVRQCSVDEIRVAFTLYFPKDGFSPSGVFGHGHDFENIIVVWRRGGDGWTRDRLLLSRHGKHVVQPWSTAESWDAGLTSAGLGRELPRIFVGWGKHAMFNHQGGLKDVASQLTDNEYRHADYPARGASVEVTDALAAAFDRHHWGSASSTPAVVARQLCGY